MSKKDFGRLSTFLCFGLLISIFSFIVPVEAQTISFDPSGLAGSNINNPTSLQFGPDGRLYVSQQDGTIWAFNVIRNGANDYAVTNTETISIIKTQIPNYNDDGTFFNIGNKRQVTGIYVTGTELNPIIYVTSSDYRIGGGPLGSDDGLDTNSGIISRLTWNGSAWDHMQLVRGLPRSEENHSINGLQLDETSNTLYVAIGGSTNAGSPSNNFAFITEYAYSGAILAVDLDAIDALPTQTENVSGQTINYKYNLPTLDDPTRPNLNGVDDPDNPSYTGIDPGDPFGGNDGLNQAKLDPSSPVQIHSPGWRNPYDIVITENGRMYSVDNGANPSWGGFPELEGESTCTNMWLTGEPGSTGSGPPPNFNTKVNNKDNLHYVTGTGFYAGHPVPVRGNPAGAGLFTHDTNGGGEDGVFRTTVLEHDDPNFATQSLPVDWPPYPVSAADPIECDFLLPGVDDNALAVWGSSTNGITEYTATNFSSQMQGYLLTASFNGTIYQIALNAAGDSGTVSNFASGFGATPLDVTAQGDDDPFAGTVWAVTYGADDITIFEPADYDGGNFFCIGNYDNTIDEDNDKYTNADEIDNGTNPCSGAETPPDFDQTDDGSGFFVSDLNDPDDDNDTLLDTYDPFAIDANNGSDLDLPLELELFNGFPGYGFYGLGFTGLMSNGTASVPGSDYLALFPDAENTIIAGGTAGLLTMLGDDGSPLTNDQLYGFQFGIDSDHINLPYTVEVVLSAPFFADSTGDPTQKFEGFYIGDGTQDNYIALLLDGNGNIRIIHEELGAVIGASSQTYAEGISIGSVATVTLYLTVDPINNTVTPAYAVNSGSPTSVGTAISPGASISDGIGGSFTIDGVESGLAIGVISSSSTTQDFDATWDNIRVDFAEVNEVGDWELLTLSTGSIDARHESGFIEVGGLMYLLGGRGNKAVNIYDPINDTWTDGANPPVEIHHIQPVEVDGLIYIVAGYSGSCCASEFGLDHIYIYDPVGDEWHQGAEIPVSRRRGSVGTVVYNNEIYIIGGLEGGHGAPATSFPYFDKFDPTTNTWTILPDAPRDRDHFSAVLINEKIYLAGGRHTDSAGFFNNTIGEVDVYSLTDGTWSTLPAGSNIPTERAGTMAAGLGADIVVVGGEGNGQAYDTAEALNSNSNNWRILDSLNVARHSGGMAECNGTLYVAAGSGGQGGSPQLDSAERYSLYEPTVCARNAYITGILSVDASAIDFGTVTVGNNDTQTVTLSNTGGTQAILITDLSISGSSDVDASLEYDAPVVIAPGDSITLDITFTPTTSSALDATVTINSSNPFPIVISLEADGTNTNDNDPIYRVNAGGGTVADTPIPWDDQAAYVSGGSNSGGGQADTNNTDAPDGVFDAEHYGNQTWTFSSLPAGDYIVNLYFLEGWNGANGADLREFDVEINGVQVLDNFDIWEETGGLNIATSQTFDTTVDVSGVIVVELINDIQNAAIRGIEIIPKSDVGPIETVLYRINVGGPEVAAADSSIPNWGSDSNANPSVYRSGGGNTYNGSAGSAHPGPIIMTHPSLLDAPAAPQQLFETERWDNGGTIDWAFPVSTGQNIEVRLYFAELFNGIDQNNERVMDVTVEGLIPTVFDDIDPFATAGAKGALMLSYQLVAPDDLLNISVDGVIENPALKGIEIISSSTNPAPVVTNPGNQVNEVDDVVDLSVPVDDDDNFTCEATNLPDGLSIDDSCQITGTVNNTCSGLYQETSGSLIEQGGLLVADVEFAPTSDFWTQETTQADAIDGSYYEWRTGNNDGGLIDPAGTLGVLQYPIQITNPGIYRFQIRSSSINTTEHNDVYSRFVDADKVFGIKSGFPDDSSSSQTGYYAIGNGWFKTYQNTSSTDWTWQTRHKDNDAHNIYVEFENPGEYMMELSGRSTLFKIDRLILFKKNVNQITARSNNTEQSETTGAICSYDVEVTATDDGTPTQSTSVNFNWIINVSNLNLAPTIDPIDDQSVIVDQTLDVDIITADFEADPTILDVEVRDSDSNLMDNTFYQLNDFGNGAGIVTFTPTSGQEGIYDVIIFADDTVNVPSEEAFTLTVLEPETSILDVTDENDLSIDSIDFGAITTTQTSAAVTINLENLGTVNPINITQIQISGTNATDFSISSTSPVTIDGLGSESLTLDFTPSTIGVLNATLEITHDGINGPLTTIDLTGVGKASEAILYRVNVGGAQLVAADSSSPNWSADTNANPSSYRSGGGNIYNGSAGSAHPGPIIMTHPSLLDAPGAPQQLFESERWDNGGTIDWAFPVTIGQNIEVRLYFAELFSGVDQAGERVIDVSVEGIIPSSFNDIDAIATAGPKGAFMVSYRLTTPDEILNISVDGIVENPSLKGVEIITVPDANTPPVIDPIADVTINEFESTTVTVTTSDVDDDTVTLSPVLPLPDFVSWDNVDTFTISPDINDAGSYSVTIEASDSSETVQESFDINVIDRTIEITSPASGTVISGDSVTVMWASSGTSPNDHIHVTLDNEPYIGGQATNGSYIFSDLEPGLHTITVQMADMAHVLYDGVVDEITFTVLADVLYRVNVGGAQLVAADSSSPNWSADNNANPSSYRTGGGNIYTGSAGSAHPGPIIMTHPSLLDAPGAPQQLFESERWDNGGTIDWAFPVATGQNIEVRLYFAELFSGVDQAGERVIDASVEGIIPSSFNDIDAIATAGPKGAFMVSYRLTTPDEILNISVDGIVENPSLKGVEIIEVPNTNTPPVIDPIADVTINEFESTTVTVTTSDVDDDTVTLSPVLPLPDFVSWDNVDTFTISPQIDDAGAYTILIDASDSSDTVQESFDIDVIDRTIEITSPASGTVISGDSVTVMWASSGTSPNDHIHVTLDNEPYIGGQATNGSYTFSGLSVGSHTIKVEMADMAHVLYTNISDTITFSRASVGPIVESIVDQTVEESSTLLVNISSTDTENDPIVISATVERDSDNAVMGNAFYTLTDNTDGTGNLNFTPAVGEVGTYTVTVTASDSITIPPTEITFILTVTDNELPNVAQLADQTNDEGDNLGGTLPAVEINATDPETDPMTYSISGQPAGLSIDETTGAIQGTIAAGAATSSPYTVTVSVSDDVNPTPTQMTFQWTIIAPNSAPIVNAGDDANAYLPVGTYTLQGAVNDLTPTGTIISEWTAVGPATVSFADSSDPTTTATFTTLGTYTLTLTSSDGLLSSSDDVVITVLPPTLVKLELWNAATDSYIRDLQDVDTIDLLVTPDITVIAVTEPAIVGSVKFVLDSVAIRTENAAPYAIGADNGLGNVDTWDIGIGQYILSAVPYTGQNTGGIEGIAKTIDLTVTGNYAPVITQLADQISTENDNIAGLQVVATDAENDTLLYNIAGQPAGINIDLFSGVISGNIASDAANGSPYTVIVSIFDGVNPSPSQMTFQWTVQDFVPTNNAPLVNAGNDATITLPNTYVLQGSVNDPTPTGTLTSTWSGPAGVNFTDANDPQTTVSFNSPGTYTLTLTGNDGTFSANDSVNITVLAQAVGPQVIQLELWDSSTDTLIRKLLATDTINLSTTPNITVVAITNPGTVGSVVFDLTDSTPSTASTTDTTAPYAIADDTAGDLNDWGIGVGDYTLEVAAFENNDGTGLSANTITVDLSVIQDNTENMAPIIPSQTFAVESNEFINFNLSLGVFDPDGHGIASVQIIDGPDNGVISGISPNLTYTPNPSFIGDDTILVAAQDNLGAVSVATYTMAVRRTATNEAPVANAGADGSVILPNTYVLQGSVNDPTATGTLTATWSGTGPGTVSFTDNTNPTTTVSFSTAGTYTLTLTANDGEFNHADDVTIIVNPVNAEPVANAGADASITLPNNTYGLVGNANDPTPTGTLNTQWTGVGPGTVTFTNASSLITNVQFSAAGTYTLTLTADDGLLTDSDDVIITVNPAVPTQSVVTLQLWNADTDSYIRNLNATDTIDLAVTPNVNIVAVTNPTTVGSVRFFLDGVLERNENVGPYTIAGDNGSNYDPWSIAVGTYALTATSYSASNGGGTAGGSVNINLTVVNG